MALTPLHVHVIGAFGERRHPHAVVRWWWRCHSGLVGQGIYLSLQHLGFTLRGAEIEEGLFGLLTLIANEQQDPDCFMYI